MYDKGKKLAAIWCRVSTDGQRELSLDSQVVSHGTNGMPFIANTAASSYTSEPKV